MMVIPKTDEQIKRCQCGREITLAEWSSLRNIGVQHMPNETFDLDLRDCPVCGSTLAVEVFSVILDDVRSGGAR